jgi:hypothetical protein
MKLEKYFLRRILICRRTGLDSSRRGAHRLTKGSGTARGENAIAAILAQNLRSRIFRTRPMITLID